MSTTSLFFNLWFWAVGGAAAWQPPPPLWVHPCSICMSGRRTTTKSSQADLRSPSDLNWTPTNTSEKSWGSLLSSGCICKGTVCYWNIVLSVTSLNCPGVRSYFKRAHKKTSEACVNWWFRGLVQGVLSLQCMPIYTLVLWVSFPLE